MPGAPSAPWRAEREVLLALGPQPFQGVCRGTDSCLSGGRAAPAAHLPDQNTGAWEVKGLLKVTTGLSEASPHPTSSLTAFRRCPGGVGGCNRDQKTQPLSWSSKSKYVTTQIST